MKIHSIKHNNKIMSTTIKYSHFHNNTDLPIMINSWIDGSNKLQYIKISPYEKRIIHSSVGEWHLNTMFDSLEDRRIWEDKGFNLARYITIGKFRSNRSASGNYSWMEDDIFECIYTELIDDFKNVKGLITFSYSNL